MIKYKVVPYLVGLIFLLNFINITFAHTNRLVNKQVFLYEFPRYLSFREENKFVNTDYKTWSQSVSQTSGLMKKFISEELIINPQAAKWANQYAANNPEKIVMLHLNGEARQVQDFPEVLKRYFPGHWVYMAGSFIKSDLTKNDKVIKITNIKPFIKKGYVVRKSNPIAYFPLKALLVRLDDNGNKLWYESEFIEIESVDKEHNIIQIKRGIYGSKPLDFKGGKSYIAPLAGCHWGKHIMLYYNLSDRCPRDINGKQAKDIFAEEIASWFMDNGRLCNFDGIAFDVNYFDISRNADWDVDNNGIADGGWIGGQNVWKIGDIYFLASLRNKLGWDFIISADGQHPHNQQLPSVLNGIESEGLVQHNDMWRGFSRAINTHLYWQGHLCSPYDFRYVVMKVMGKDASDGVHMRRFGAATAFCLGASITTPVGEDKDKPSVSDFIPKEFCREGSLGEPVGDLIRYAECKKPYFVIKGSDLAVLEKNCNCEISGESMILTSPLTDLLDEGEKSEILLKLQDISLPKGDAVFEVKAQILEYDTDLSAKYKVPAIMWFRPDKLPILEQKIYNEYFNDIYGLFGSEKVEKMTYYFRKLDGGNHTINLKIVGANKIRIDELRVYDAPDVIIRKFENGVIIVNPSLNSVSLDIGKYIKNKGKKVISIPPIDAVYLKFN